MDRWRKELSKEIVWLTEKNLLRELIPHRPDSIDFSSNDYLSLNRNGVLKRIIQEYFQEYFQEAQQKGKRRELGGSTGSRLIRGHYHQFSSLEEYFAQSLALPSSLFFSTGYAANLGALQAILSPRSSVFCDQFCHSSILDGVRLSMAKKYYFHHNDLEDLQRKLKRRRILSRKKEDIWILTEAIFSMEGDSPDLPNICSLAEEFGAKVYLDEGHSLGLYQDGRGLSYELGLQDRIAVSVFPCGKGVGFTGALVCGPPELKSLLINRARSFIYSTAPPPWIASILERIFHYLFSSELESSRRHLHSLSVWARKLFQEEGFPTGKSTTHILPILLGSEEKTLSLAEECYKNGLDIRPIRPPTVPKGSSRLRLNLQAAHTREEVQKLCNVLKDSR